MNNLPASDPISDPFMAFRQGCSGAFRHYFIVHQYRIYCYLLSQTHCRQNSSSLTRYCFIALFRNFQVITDENHLIKRLYALARACLLFDLRDQDAVRELEREWQPVDGDDDTIMEDPAVTRNESLLTIQDATQKLSGTKRELAELYFFQGLTIEAIVPIIRVEETIIRRHISQMLIDQADQLEYRKKMKFLIGALSAR